MPTGSTSSSKTLLRVWASCLLAISIAQGSFARHVSASAMSTSSRAIVLASSVCMLLLALATLVKTSSVAAIFTAETAPDSAARVARHPLVTLFLASFAALFIEVMLIRYAGSQIRIFAFYKNIPLISAYLGLGMGCWLGKGNARHVLAFLAALLPIACALSLGASFVGRALGTWSATGSTEHILGDFMLTNQAPLAAVIAAQAWMALFCVTTLVAFTLLFALIGRLLGAAFEGTDRLQAYTINILGSLAGIVVFLTLSYFETPPSAWFVVGLVPLLWWLPRSMPSALAGALIVLVALTVAPSFGHTVWSRYQKLVGIEVPAGLHGSRTRSPGYLIDISDVFYQVALDLRPESRLPEIGNPFPHYDHALNGLHGAERALIVGAGSGNDVAAALRAGIQHVDAVDIDPAIVAMGRVHHPEHPYDDPRVNVIIDDARAAFRKLPAHSYDVVVFGLLDSHTQLAMSSLRLDNYVFTLESLASVRRLLKPGGTIALTAATARAWFRARLALMLIATCDSSFDTQQNGAWASFRCVVDRPGEPAPGPRGPGSRVDLPTDDWPFLYLPDRSIPWAYLVVVPLMILASLITLQRHGLGLRELRPYHGHMFFLGAAFLLMEVQAVNRLALLFGTTWLVSAVTIGLVLVLIVAANLTTQWRRNIEPGTAYLALFACLLLSYALPPTLVQGRGLAPAVGYGLLQLSPVYCAGLVFARSFSRARFAGAALGANMLGSVLGGWVEYCSMIVGFRALLLVALAFYLASLLLLLRDRDRAPSGAVSTAAAPGS